MSENEQQAARCDGSVFCLIPGHIIETPTELGTRIRHIPTGGVS